LGFSEVFFNKQGNTETLEFERRQFKNVLGIASSEDIQ